jgi:adenylate cyclase
MNSPRSAWHFYNQPTAFVGRVRELHRLREVVRNAIDDRQRQAVLVTGPAGIGKSRLIGEFLASIGDHVDQITVLSGSFRPGAAPYQIFDHLLRQRFEIAADLPPEAVVLHLGAGLASVLADPASADEASHFIGHLLGLRVGDSPHIRRVEGDPGRIEERAVGWLTRLLSADAERRPLVICTDDLHHASDEALALLLRLSEKLAALPLIFMSAAREMERPAQRAFLGTVERVGEVMALPALSDRDGRRIVASLLARASDVPDAFVQLAVEKAFGNPLSIEQIIELQIERGAVEISDDGWRVHAELLDDTRIPGSLRDVVRSKIERLSPLERSVLEKAATVGERFWLGSVAMLRRVDEGHQWDDADRFWTTDRRDEELARVLEALRRRHIVLRLPESDFAGTRAYQFKHSVEREVLYEGIEGPRRARYHRLVAQWLERQAAGDTPAELIAHHWERGHLPRKAARYYQDAADRAGTGHQNREAISLYRRTLGCLTDDDAAERLGVFHKLGKVHMVLGDTAEALGHFQEMLRLAWLLDDERQGGLAYNKMGQIYRALGEYDLAIEQFKNGLALFRRVEDVRGLASTADDIGSVYRMRGQLDKAEERIREGLRLRRFLGDTRSVAVSLLHLGTVYTERGDFKAAVPIMREALDLARQTGDLRTEADVLMSTGAICYHRGALDQALELWTEALGTARTLGERLKEGMLLNNMGETLLTLGRSEEARATLEESAQILEAIGDRRCLSDALRNLGAAYLQRGDYARALELCEQALEAARDVGALGQAGLAERSLAEVRSRTLYDDAPDREARIEAASTHFENAIRALEEVGQEAELARALLAQGAFLAEVGRVEEAREQLRRAREVFARLGMKEALERADRLREVL